MKKLRMIVTSVIVLAIVGSALAFNAKKLLVVCYSSVTGSNVCDQTITARQIVATGGSPLVYYSGWNGLLSECTATGNHNCTTTANFAADF